MKNKVIAALLTAWLSVPVLATPFWVAYEGDDLPTNQGWSRSTFGPPATITQSNGLLRIDGRSSIETADVFRMYPSDINPESGEYFVFEWSVLVLEANGILDRDVGVTVVGNGFWTLGFEMNETSIESGLEVDRLAHIAPNEFHSYRVISSDMREYSLFIDDQLAMQGRFFYGTSGPFVSFGDNVIGASSDAVWDYVRFGVVPEPSSLTLLIAFCVLKLAQARGVFY